MVANKLKRLWKSILVLLVLLAITGCKGQDDKITIGIVQIVEHSALDSAREGFKSTFENKDIVFLEENAQGDIATAQLIVEGFKEKKVDLIYAIATPVAQAAYNTTKEIPIIISAVTDPLEAGLIESWEIPNTNVSGTSDMAPIKEQLELIKKIGIKGNTIGFIYNSSESNSEVQLKKLKIEAENIGYDIISKSITNLSELEQTLDLLLDETDMIYTPTDNLVASGINLITEKAKNKNKPIIGAEKAHVESGALYTCGVDYIELGKLSGNMANKVLAGEDISKMSIKIADNPEIVINKKVLENLNLEIDKSIEDSVTWIGGN